MLLSSILRSIETPRKGGRGFTLVELLVVITVIGSGIDALGTGDGVLTTSLGFSKGDAKGAHNLHFWSYHPGGGQFALGDGSTRFISYAVDYKTFVALGTLASGEVVGRFD